MKDRIGTIDSLPPLTVSGKPYTRPCSTLSLGGGHVVVLDIFGNTQEEIDAVRASIKPVSKSKKTSVSEDE